MDGDENLMMYADYINTLVWFCMFIESKVLFVKITKVLTKDPIKIDDLVKLYYFLLLMIT